MATGRYVHDASVREDHPDAQQDHVPPRTPGHGTPESPAAREAKDALRLRYANGEISREDYLQGKVELED
jgi:hypothetical protein